jgi:hypothetical protein
MEQPAIDATKLDRHLRLCRRNLKGDRVKCCASCPFEAIIVAHAPELTELFERKRSVLAAVPSREALIHAKP